MGAKYSHQIPQRHEHTDRQEHKTRTYPGSQELCQTKPVGHIRQVSGQVFLYVLEEFGGVCGRHNILLVITFGVYRGLQAGGNGGFRDNSLSLLLESTGVYRLEAMVDFGTIVCHYLCGVHVGDKSDIPSF